MDWNELITTRRLGQEERHVRRTDDRTEYKRDYDRLIFSAPFRRMQNKTQVFPLPGSVFVHNRLTHSLEVASVGMSLGCDVAKLLMERHPELCDSQIAEIGTIVSTACLAHDMGNPPFGHSGEKAIQTYFTEGEGQALRSVLSDELWSDVTHFEGNANAFRLLTHQFKGRRKGGFVMTYPTVAAMVKYPFESAAAGSHGKFGFFASERECFVRIFEELGIARLGDAPLRYARHPLVYLVEAADDICYEIMDIEDSHKLRLLSFDETQRLLLAFFGDNDRERILRRIIDEEITDDNEKVVFMRARVIGLLEHLCVEVFVKHEEEIIAGRFGGSLIDYIAEPCRTAYKHCAETSYNKIYHSKPVLDVELGGYKIMETLMSTFVDAAVHPDKFHSKQLIMRVSSQYDIDNPDLGERIMAVIDYISGMTDVYALDVYQKINGTSLPIV